MSTQFMPLLSSLLTGLIAIAVLVLSRRREDRIAEASRLGESQLSIREKRALQCARLIGAADLLVQGDGLEKTRANLDDAHDMLLLLGPEDLASTAAELVAVSRQEGFVSSAYTKARADFYRAANRTLGYCQRRSLQA